MSHHILWESTYNLSSVAHITDLYELLAGQKTYIAYIVAPLCTIMCDEKRNILAFCRLLHAVGMTTCNSHGPNETLGK